MTNMWKEWSRRHRVLVVIDLSILAGLVAAWGAYALVGHSIIGKAYRGESLPVLNRAISGSDVHPLGFYLEAADRMMLLVTGVVLVLAIVATAVAMRFSPRTALDPRRSTTVLGLGLWGFCLAAAVAVFIYPLEIETREATVWLAVLASKAGVDLYDRSQALFVNHNHGPFDPMFKTAVATVFPFLESWQVTRFPMILLPFAHLAIAWKLIRKFSSRTSPWSAFCLAGVGCAMLIVTGKEFLFVGRSDATVALLLLPALYVVVASSPRTLGAAVRDGAVVGIFGVLVALTNWRTVPTVGLIALFALWRLWKDTEVPPRLLRAAALSGALSGLVVTGAIVYSAVGFDLALYNQYFFGFYHNAAGWTHHGSLAPYGYPYPGSPVAFVLSLLNPTAPPDSLKGGPVLMVLAVYFLLPARREPGNRAWVWLGLSSFVFCALAYYMNYRGGGAWYFIPFVAIVWFMTCDNASRLTPLRLNLLALLLLALLAVNYRTVISPTLTRIADLQRAWRFMGELRSIPAGDIYSEDVYFHRTHYQGELIDMGDTVSEFAEHGYFGEAFAQKFEENLARLKRQPPEYIVRGFTDSPELKAMVKADYVKVRTGPPNFTANGLGRTILYRRKDLGESDRWGP